MTAPIPRLGTAPSQPVQRSRGARMVGLAIASFAPGMFWSVLIAVTAAWLGEPLNPLTIVMTCAAITAFLAIACAPFILRDPPHRAVNTAAGAAAARRPSPTVAVGKDAA